MRRLAQAMGRLCRGDDAIAAAETAVSILEPLGPTAELAWAYSVLAGQRMMSGQDGAAIDLAQRAQAIAGPLGEARVLSDALNTEACATASMDDQRWVGLMRRSLEVALEQHLESQAGRAYANIFTCYCQERRYSEAEPYYLAGVTYCDERDLATMANTLRGTYSVVLEETGRWDEAVVLSRELLINVGASPINRLCPLTRLGKINARRGEPGVWEYLDEAMTVAEATGEPQQIVPLRVARAEAYWLEGKSAEATREAELADDVSDRCDRWDRGAARTWLRRTDSARSPRDDVADPYLMQINGDWKQAARFWSGAGCQYQAALALFDSADEVALRQALEIFAGLGASATARVTRQRMRALGIRSIPSGPRTATRAQPFGLTKREREVLHLICGRHTNADIAARLFISEKTVHHHVSAVLAKMGAPTRGAAAAQAVELGLVPAEK
jgi:DNA-binding CsgD family transcriptional regulator